MSEVSGKTILAHLLPTNRIRCSLVGSWEFVVGGWLLMKAERDLKFSTFIRILACIGTGEQYRSIIFYWHACLLLENAIVPWSVSAHLISVEILCLHMINEEFMTQFDMDCRGMRNQFSKKTATCCCTEATRNTLTIASCMLCGSCIDGVTKFQDRMMRVQGESKSYTLWPLFSSWNCHDC